MCFGDDDAMFAEIYVCEKVLFEPVRSYFMRLKCRAVNDYVEKVGAGCRAQQVNRTCWIHAWELCAKEGGMVEDGDKLLAWYLSWCRSSCSVERLLGDSAGEGERRRNLSAHHLRNSVSLRRFGFLPRKNLQQGPC